MQVNQTEAKLSKLVLHASGQLFVLQKTALYALASRCPHVPGEHFGDGDQEQSFALYAVSVGKVTLADNLECVLLPRQKQSRSTESTTTHSYLDNFSARYRGTTLLLCSHPMTASLQSQENKYPLFCFNYQLLSTYQFPPLLSRSGFPESVHITTDRDLPPNSRFGFLSEPSFWMHDQHPISCQSIHMAIRIFPFCCFFLYVTATPEKKKFVKKLMG